MAITNQERVGKALDLLRDGLRPFVEREMKAVHNDQWEKIAEQGFPNAKGKGAIKWTDLANLLSVMINEWSRVFERTLGRTEKNTVHALKDTRNKWAHNEAFSSDEVYRAMDNAGLLLAAISAPQSEEIEKSKMELLRTRFEDQRRSEVRRAAVTAVEGRPAAGLRPWREIITPHVDVASGRYQQAEFAADLWQVYQNEGSDEYKHPVEFFRRTFITDGLKHLLVGAIRRLKANGGDPVVELQTNFGGGKTHSMLALYHLFGGSKATDLAGVDALVKEAGVDVAGGVKRAILVGTKISPGQPSKKPDGTIVRTLWGEMAWQLGGKEGYKMIAADDEKATNPGEALTRLFNKFAPCLILIDEWVAYARQLHERNDLPGGTFETQFTFAQALTESAKAAKNTLLVVSIPASESPHQRDDTRVTDVEVGGSRGRESLVRLKNAIGRVESTWRPASPEEGFEIVRRRLFQPITDPALFASRDASIRAFMEMYSAQHQEFPPECREMDYERRFKAAYPIHPELFDRLFNDWSTLERFQRTRGVLRLMAAVIHSLWERNDQSVAIMPAQVPIDDPNVQGELTRYLDDNWPPVISKDVDGPHSLPLTLDRENPNLGKFSAARRVARAIYLGSAPTQKAANRGIDDRQIKLGCVQPGETTATFGDALRHLSNRATYLYVDGKRFWYSTQPTVTRLADDRAAQLEQDPHAPVEEIVKRLRKEAVRRGDFDKVHACPAGSGDVPDEPEARLVILGPEHPHTNKDATSAARQEAAAMLESRGNSPRNYRNTIVFLAADGNRLKELEQAVRQFLAWNSIWDEREQLNLDPFQNKQAETKRKSAEETVEARIPEAYQWLIIPTQPDPKGPIEWVDIRLQGADGLAVRAAKKMKNDDHLRTQMGGNMLRLELDRIPLWRGDHVGLKQLAEDVAKYLYLPRLVDRNVLVAAVRDGLNRLTWQTEAFAYAERYDESSKRYVGLQAGHALQVVIDGQSVLVKPDVAARQIAEDRAEQLKKTEGDKSTGGSTDQGGATGDGGVKPEGDGTKKVEPVKPKLKRFHGTVEIDTLRVGIKAGDVAREVIQHLTTLTGASVKVVLEIEAEIPDGAPDDVVRTITENCRTLRFGSHGFEES
jgi:predicted AAA+ superfamily ATPase